MSRRSSSHHRHSRDRGHGGHAGDRHHDYTAWAQRQAAYTLVHAGRQLRLGPIAFWIVVGTLVIMAGWSIITATYFDFRDDVITRLISRQAEMQFGYEDRITELRTRVDRISGRQLIDQEQYEQKLDQILRRQSALESRASALGGLGDLTGAIKPAARGGVVADPRPSSAKSPLLKDKGAFLPPDRNGAIDPRTSLFAASAGGIGGAIIRLQASLDRIEQRQTATINSLADSYDFKARHLRGVLTDLGLAVGKPAAETAFAMGGPFVPAAMAKEALGFEQQLNRIRFARATVTRLTRTLGSVPVRKPIDGDLELMSGFGVRTDPFTSSPAMHTGLDLHGETGDPVRATADGVVTAAGWSGGYGRVVDIDHGNGLSTRYGHLSSIDVRIGQAVRCGQIIGKVGSTGRSTGPHLHYETRVRHEVVDPQKFLRAGQRLDGSI
jgi:murein DD-endopeptidase MepM/ murein hydrolase activator NlpD